MCVSNASFKTTFNFRRAFYSTSAAVSDLHGWIPACSFRKNDIEYHGKMPSIHFLAKSIHHGSNERKTVKTMFWNQFKQKKHSHDTLVEKYSEKIGFKIEQSQYLLNFLAYLAY